MTELLMQHTEAVVTAWRVVSIAELGSALVALTASARLHRLRENSFAWYTAFLLICLFVEAFCGTVVALGIVTTNLVASTVYLVLVRLIGRAVMCVGLVTYSLYLLGVVNGVHKK